MIAEPLDLAAIRARVEAATGGTWSFAIAPAEGSDETKAEYMAGALTNSGPLYALFVEESVGQVGGYIVPAITGDGPNARNNAAFIAHARTDIPALLAEVERLRAGIERALLRNWHSDTCAHSLAYANGFTQCNCWKQDLRATLTDGATR